jgi:protease-4
MDSSPIAPPPSASPPRRRGPSPALLLTLGCGGFLVLAVVGVGVLLAVGEGSHRVAASTVLRMKVGELPEFVRESQLLDLFDKAPVTVHDHLVNLQKAAKDSRIKGVFLELEGTTAGWAKIEELRAALLDFKKSGKFVVAYSEGLTEKEYALALAADEIIMPRDAYFEFNGLASEVSHYPGLLEKLGIEVQYFRYGKYKSVSGESYGRKALTAPVKEMITQNLALVFEHFITAVAEHRQLEVAQVRALIDEGRLKSDWALEHKLIDRLAYFDEVEATLKERMKLEADTKLTFVSASRYREVTPSDVGLPEGRDVVAVVYSVGLIVSGRGGDDNQGSEPLIKSLRRAVEDKTVKAIVLRVDSPGGAGLGCDYVRREVERARAKKPVIVSMSDVAASGGYWISMDATAIVAQPTTATGSIGIFSVIPNLGGLYEKLGLNHETFTQGAHADVMTLGRKMTPEETKRFDDDLFGSYQRFVELAAKGRHRSVEELEEVAQGRTWYGSEALEKGLVDGLGGFSAAIALAKDKAAIPAATPVKVEVFEKHTSFLEELLQGDDSDEEGPELADVVLGKLLGASGLKPVLRKVPAALPLAHAVLAGETTFPMAEYQLDIH